MKNVIKLDISLKVTQRPNLFYPGEHCVSCQIFTVVRKCRQLHRTYLVVYMWVTM